MIVARVPVNSSTKKWDQSSNFHSNAEQPHHHHQQQSINSASESMDLSKMNGSEEDKIQAMITQSTLDYDPTK